MNGAGSVQLCGFDAPVSLMDGQGGVETGFQEQFQARARIRYLRGSEQVIGARLSGVQPVVVGVRRNSNTQAITNGWRIRILRTGALDGDGHWTGQEVNIQTILPSDNLLYLEITGRIGVPA